MDAHQLDSGQKITYMTRYGGHVIVRPAPSKARQHLAKCDVCGEEYPSGGRLMVVRDWAEKHALACIALPKDYIDCRTAAMNYAEHASSILYSLPNAPDDQREILLAEADIRARLAATYAELARHHGATM